MRYNCYTENSRVHFRQDVQLQYIKLHQFRVHSRSWHLRECHVVLWRAWGRPGQREVVLPDGVEQSAACGREQVLRGLVAGGFACSWPAWKLTHKGGSIAACEEPMFLGAEGVLWLATGFGPSLPWHTNPFSDKNPKMLDTADCCVSCAGTQMVSRGTCDTNCILSHAPKHRAP